MRLSQMTTEQATEALVIIAPEVQTIMQDGELMAELKKGTDSKKKAVVDVVMEKVVKLIPAILGKHKDGVFRVLAALNCVTPEDIAAQNVLVTIAQVKELFEDKELIDFFTASNPMEQGA